MTGVFLRKGETQAHEEGREALEGRGGNWSDDVTSQGPQAAVKSWERREALRPGASRSVVFTKNTTEMRCFPYHITSGIHVINMTYHW